MAKRKFFGTDGVRGRVGKSPMTPDFLVKLGFAAGRVLAGRGEPTVLIGKDTRLSGYLVESALEAGFAAAGVDVILSGPLPTAAVSYLTQALRLSAGIVVSASHNPHHDNGVKFFGADGEKLPDAVEAQIEEKLRGLRDLSFAGRPGRARRLDDAVGRYIEFCKRAFPARLSLRGVKIVVDCANGAAYHCAPAIFHELGAEVETIGCEPDGENINVGCGALCPRPAARLVKKIGADCGVVLDGDADRVLLIDAAGRVLDGDCLLWILCGEEARRGEKPTGIVGTELSNGALESALAKKGIDFARARVGDRYVTELLRAKNWRIGGEPAGHLILRDFCPTGDGVIGALRALSALAQTGKTLAELAAGYKPRPQQSLTVPASDRRRALAAPALRKCLRAIRARLGANGRVVLRASGTEPALRVMVEAKEADVARRAAAQLAAVIGGAE